MFELTGSLSIQTTAPNVLCLKLYHMQLEETMEDEITPIEITMNAVYIPSSCRWVDLAVAVEKCA
jgi:hypothetical protein